MLELCTKKRMIISIIALGILTILILILENKLTQDEKTPSPTLSNDVSQNPFKGDIVLPLQGKSLPSQQFKPVDSNNNSIDKGDCVLITNCTPCSDFEIRSKSPEACLKTKLKEVYRCSKSGLEIRSCTKVAHWEKRQFYVFQALMLLLAVISAGLVKFRSSQLDRVAAKILEKRLQAGAD